MTTSDHLVVSEVFGPTVQGEGPSLGRRAAFVRLGRCNLECTWCFVPETKVLMADGSTRRLDGVACGDLVMSYKHDTYTASRVLAVVERTAPTVIVRTARAALRCSPDHVFHVGEHPSGRTKVRAEEAAGAMLKLSDLTAAGGAVECENEEYWKGYLQGTHAGGGYCSVGTGASSRPMLLWQVTDRDFADAICLTANRLGSERCSVTTDRRGYRVSAPMTDLEFVLDLPRLPEEIAGYVAGFFDAEGVVAESRPQLAMCQKDDKVLRRLQQMLAGAGLVSSLRPAGRSDATALVVDGVESVDRFLATFRPKVRGKAAPKRAIPGSPLMTDEVLAVDDAPPTRVVNLTTTVGNFFAEGYLVDQCDTPYSWRWSDHDPAAELTSRSSDSIAAEVEAMQAPLVVITGGEPLLQQAHLVQLVERLHATGHHIELETAGTIAPKRELTEYVDSFNVSPKLANSGNPVERRYKPDVLRALEATGKAVFKFVVVEEADLEEVGQIVGDCELADVWIMPEGTEAGTLLARQRKLADAVLARGWHMTTRLHVLLWGNERGH